jgi:hypothetical protein
MLGPGLWRWQSLRGLHNAEESRLGYELRQCQDSAPPVPTVRAVDAWTLQFMQQRISPGTSETCLGSGLTANRTNQFNASGLYPAFDVMFLFASTSALL